MREVIRLPHRCPLLETVGKFQRQDGWQLHICESDYGRWRATERMADGLASQLLCSRLPLLSFLQIIDPFTEQLSIPYPSTVAIRSVCRMEPQQSCCGVEGEEPFHTGQRFETVTIGRNLQPFRAIPPWEGQFLRFFKAYLFNRIWKESEPFPKVWNKECR